MNFYAVEMPEAAMGMESSDSEDADSVMTQSYHDTESDPDNGVTYEAACPDLAGTPPNPPPLRVRLFGAKRRRLDNTSMTCPVDVTSRMDTTVKRSIPQDVWRYGVVQYVDLPGLIHLSFVCRDLHDYLNQSETINTYMREAWFVKTPNCSCQRNQFRLDVSKLFEYYWDRCGVFTARDMDVALRVIGRGVDMYDDPRRSHPIRPVETPTRSHPKRYERGVLSIYYDGLIVPLPRLLSVPVECQRLGGSVQRNWTRPRELNETEEMYYRRVYWRGCHDLDNPDPSIRDNGFDTAPYVDPVKAYIAKCEDEDLDPCNPNEDDDEQSGYKAEHWARYQMHRGAVGLQTYPYELCLRKGEIRGSAFRRGVSELDMLFLPAERAPTQGDDTNIQVLMHNGLVYFHPVRYNNETGDFVPWCLSTLAVMRSIRQYVWYDAILYTSRRLLEFALLVATEVQNDFSFNQMMLRWQFLERTQVRMEARWPPEDYERQMVAHNPNEPITDMASYTRQVVALQKARNDRAGRLMRCSLYLNFNNHINRKIREFDNGGGNPDSFRSGYLVSMIPSLYDHAPVPHTETGLMRALHRHAWLADYIVEFAASVAPRVDDLTDLRRHRTLGAYTGLATSLLTFAPGFTDRPHWSPSKAARDAGSTIPRIDPTHNHRYQYYRSFLYARHHFYDAPAPLFALPL